MCHGKFFRQLKHGSLNKNVFVVSDIEFPLAECKDSKAGNSNSLQKINNEFRKLINIINKNYKMIDDGLKNDDMFSITVNAVGVYNPFLENRNAF